MKGFNRQNQLLSLCGLNCGLCPMNLDKHCPGCGGGNGNQSCKIAKCSLEHGKPEYCCDCKNYPCETFDKIDLYDSFITHQRQKADLQRVVDIGIDKYNAEQAEKMEILNTLLSNYNDGRKKTFYCVAVNLLELSEVKHVIRQIADAKDLERLSLKEKSAFVVELFQQIAKEKNIKLKLLKKK